MFTDQQHWQALGCVDDTFRTPALDRFAASSVCFTRAYCTTPQCSPSRSSILTGLYPSKTGVMGNVGAAGGDELTGETIGLWLQRAGYTTAYFGKWHLGHHEVGTAGWDEDYGVTGGEKRDDSEVTRRALDFLERRHNGDRPFALFLSYNNPHDIYDVRGDNNNGGPAAPHSDTPLPSSWYRQDFSRVPSVQRRFMTDDQGQIVPVDEESDLWRQYRDFYRGKMELVDAEMGRVFDYLDSQGLSDHTLVIVTSDHGDMDGNHRLVFKGPFMYDHMLRVPLLIRAPGENSPAGTTVPFAAVNVDLVPTMADYAGIDIPAADGVSLRPFVDGAGEPPRRDAVMTQYYSKQKWVNPIRSVCTTEYKYNRYRYHGEELYDLTQDPDETVNLAADPAYREVISRLKGTLDDWIVDNGDPFYSQFPTDREGNPLTP